MSTIEIMATRLIKAARGNAFGDVETIADICQFDIVRADIRKTASGDILVSGARSPLYSGSIQLASTRLRDRMLLMTFSDGELLRFYEKDISLPGVWKQFPARAGDGYLARLEDGNVYSDFMVASARGDLASLSVTLRS
ncbi:MAG: hypothetical protein AB7F96_02720 [Beijerinckiaceae bacterium]